MYPPAGYETPDPMLPKHHAPELELELLRSGVRRMAAQRPSCSTCRRSLLVGERLQVFLAAGSERQVCALCLGADAEGSSIGKLVRTERVRAGERLLRIRRAA